MGWERWREGAMLWAVVQGGVMWLAMARDEEGGGGRARAG